MSWKTLLLVSFLGLVLFAGDFNHGELYFLLVVASIIVKVVAGGKRKASAFLDIMAVRMEDRLERVGNVPEGLKSAAFPSMMLQTLVENAIKHGLEPKAEGGRLGISAEVVDGQLAVHVLDTGMGFMPKADEGVGLANIRERLKAMYQGRAELVISVPPTGGTRVTVKVPYETAPAAP